MKGVMKLKHHVSNIAVIAALCKTPLKHKAAH